MLHITVRNPSQISTALWVCMSNILMLQDYQNPLFGTSLASQKQDLDEQVSQVLCLPVSVQELLQLGQPVSIMGWGQNGKWWVGTGWEGAGGCCACRCQYKNYYSWYQTISRTWRWMAGTEQEVMGWDVSPWNVCITTTKKYILIDKTKIMKK